MAHVIKLGQSHVSGAAPNGLDAGEVATNTNNRKIWVGNGSGNTLVFSHADYAPASANASQSWVSSNFSNNAGDITSVTAGTGMTGGGTSGAVTLNCSITDTNTWRGLGGTSSLGHRGDHGVTAYNHSQAAHAPSNANYITNNNQLTNGAGYITSYTNTHRTVEAGGNTLGSSETLEFKAGSNVSISESGGEVTFTSTDTNTNTWRALGGNSDQAMRGDHGTTAYNHSQAAHAPSNANYITNNNQLSNGAGYATSASVTSAINAVIDSAPGALNTLNELAASLGDDANYATTVTNALAGKSSTSHTHSVTAGQFSQQNFTTTLKNKLDGIAASANNYSFPYTVSASAGNSTVVQRHSSGYIFANYINTTANVSTSLEAFAGRGHGDTYMRWYSAATARGFLNVADGATNVTNNNQLTNGAGYTTAVGDITNVIAGTGMTGGGSSGSVTLNCSITDTNTWRGLGGTSSTGHRGDHGVTAYNHSQAAHAPSNANYSVDTDTWRSLGSTSSTAMRGDHGTTAYNHSQAAHAPSNANYITNNNQLTNGASYLTTSGKAADANLLDGIDSGSFLRSNANDTFSTDLISNVRNAGIFGTYDSYKTDHIWSMGTAYRNHASGTNFGNLYGLAYKHTNNSTGGTMAAGHQMVWCDNGSPRAALGTNIWTAGTVTWSGGGSANANTAYTHSQAAHAPSNANYITNNNQLTNGAGYTTAVGDITNVIAGTGMTGGGASGSVTLNCSITDTNTWRGISNSVSTVDGGTSASSTAVKSAYDRSWPNTWRGLGETSSTSHRGDYGHTAYLHSQAAHAPSNANYITNNNQLSNGAGYITGYTNTTYTAGTGMTLSGTVFNCSITDTNTWRAIGSTSSTAMRGDHGTTAYNHSQAAHAPSNANYITNNNQLTNGAGYTTNTGDITGVTAGTACTGGGSSGAVTINVTLGNSSSNCSRGDWGAYAYDHSTGFAPNGYRHIPSNGSSGQFLGWSSTGNAAWVSNPNTDTNTTYSASNGCYLSGTDIRHTDTSSQASSSNSGQVFIQDVFLDTYGHVTGINVATASGGGGGGTTWNGMENISSLSALP